MISIVNASELEFVLRPTVYRPSSVGDRELPVQRHTVADGTDRIFVVRAAVASPATQSLVVRR